MACESPTHVILACDIDNTLRPEGVFDDRRLRGLIEVVQAIDLGPDSSFTIGTMTGRTAVDHEKLEEDDPAMAALMRIAGFRGTAVGTQVDVRDPATGLWVPAPGYPQTVGWEVGAVDALFKNIGLPRQSDEAQTPFKRSFELPSPLSPSEELAYQKALQVRLAAAGVIGNIVVSSGIFVDCLPVGPEGPVTKATAVKALGGLVIAQAALRDPQAANRHPLVIFAGDSNNDWTALEAADAAILVGNARPELQERAKRDWAAREMSDRLYIANGTGYADSIVAGLRHFGVIE